MIARNRIKVTGRESGTTIVLAHGFGCDQNIWRHVVPLLAARHRVVTFDYVGSGESDPSAYDAVKYGTLDGYASDAVDVARALELEGAVFVGHSVSAMVGVLAARRRPTAFRSLVLVGPCPRYTEAPDYPGVFERHDLDELFSLMDRNALEWTTSLAALVMGNPERPELTEELRGRFCSMRQDVARRFAEVAFFSDNRKDLAHVAVPTLVLQCTDDMVAPTHIGEYCHRAIPRSTYRQLRATGHCPQLSAPEELATVLLEWVESTP